METSSILEYAKAALSDQISYSSPDQISMFIYGPSQSLKTSIAMDLATNISKSAYCQICGEISHGCDCCYFVMIKSTKKRTALKFPMVCYHRRDEESKEESTTDPNDMDVLLPCGRATSKRRERRTWNENTLRHIQIKYMTKFSDVILFLASVQLLPPHFRPQLGIIIDDIECFLDDVGDTDCESKVGENVGFLRELNNDDRNQITHTVLAKKRNTYLSNEQAIKLLQMSKCFKQIIVILSPLIVKSLLRSYLMYKIHFILFPPLLINSGIDS